jgi:hypothetical protein
LPLYAKGLTMKNPTSSNVPMIARTMAMTAAGLLLAVALTSAPSPAMAQHPCEPSAHRLCSQFIPNETDVGNCLRRNIRRVDAACRATMGSGKAAKRAAKKKAQSH